MACGWTPSYERCTPDSADGIFLAGVSPALREQAEEAATDLLSRWTGDVYGACPVTVRPCRRDYTPGTGELLYTSAVRARGATGAARGLLPAVGAWQPTLAGGRWYNIGCGSCSTSSSSCACPSPSSLILHGYVQEVTAVVIDGETLPPTAYRVDSHRVLTRVDGGSWPTSNDLDVPLGSPGTWSVTYTCGYPLPAGGQLAAGALSLEIMKSLCNDSSCRLPERVTSIQRQGVTVTLMDTFDDLDRGHTGIWLVDSWVASVTRPAQPARVYSPDRGRYGYRRSSDRGW